LFQLERKILLFFMRAKTLLTGVSHRKLLERSEKVDHFIFINSSNSGVLLRALRNKSMH
jgi:hypothetical protein